MIDHFAFAQAAAGVQQPGFDTLVDLLKNGNIYVKLSRVASISNAAPDYADVTAIARVLIAANPHRLLWGTDWPHSSPRPGNKPTDVTPYADIDDGRIFNQFPNWAPDDAIRKQILVDNPARLYGF